MAFVLKLEKGYYLVQFRQYAWVHLILLFVFMPSSFFVSNIFDGIIWFLLPCSLVIINDIGAYLAGKSSQLFCEQILLQDHRVWKCIMQPSNHASKVSLVSNINTLIYQD